MASHCVSPCDPLHPTSVSTSVARLMWTAWELPHNVCGKWDTWCQHVCGRWGYWGGTTNSSHVVRIHTYWCSQSINKECFGSHFEWNCYVTTHVPTRPQECPLNLPPSVILINRNCVILWTMLQIERRCAHFILVYLTLNTQILSWISNCLGWA